MRVHVKFGRRRLHSFFAVSASISRAVALRGCPLHFPILQRNVAEYELLDVPGILRIAARTLLASRDSVNVDSAGFIRSELCRRVS